MIIKDKRMKNKAKWIIMGRTERKRNNKIVEGNTCMWIEIEKGNR